MTDDIDIPDGEADDLEHDHEIHEHPRAVDVLTEEELDAGADSAIEEDEDVTAEEGARDEYVGEGGDGEEEE